MMFFIIIAIALPWLSGSLATAALMGRPRSAIGWCMITGCGYFVGAALVALLTWLVVSSGGGFVVICLALLAVCGLSYYQLSTRPDLGVRLDTQQTGPASWQSVLWWALLMLLAWRFAGLATEVFMRPVLPWDAWSTWELKAKVWFGLGQIVDFKHPRMWLENPADAYPLEAWLYPPLAPLVQLWMAMAVGDWNEPIVAAPWWFAGAAILIAMYGFLRHNGAPPWVAMLVVWCLGSLPFFGVHVALAGYADLWLASFLGITVMVLFTWIQAPDKGHLLLFVFLLLMLPVVKVEGWAWGVIVAVAAVFTGLRPRSQVVVSVLFALVSVVWWVAGGFRFDIDGIGEVIVSPSLLQIPLVLSMQLGFTNTFHAFWTSFALTPNWHLYWYAAIPALVLLVPRHFRRKIGMLTLMILLGALALYVLLYFFSDFSRWAEDRTSSNRVLFHFVPALTFILGMLSSYSSSSQVPHQAGRQSR